MRAASVGLIRAVAVVGAVSALLFGGCCFGGKKVTPAPPVDVELINAATAAGESFSRAAYEAAARQYLRALQRARLVDHAPSICNQAYNLALCQLVLGRPAAARELLGEAEWAGTRAGEPLADVLLLQARLAVQQADAARPTSVATAKAAIAAVTSDPRAQAGSAHQCHAALLAAEFAAQRGLLAEAMAELLKARDLAGPTPAPALTAALARVNGQLLLMQHQPAAAATECDREVDVYRELRRYADLVRALQRAGDAWRQAGDATAAADHYYRAARSLQSLGHLADAQTAAATAQSLVNASTPAALSAAIAALLDELRQAAPIAPVAPAVPSPGGTLPAATP